MKKIMQISMAGLIALAVSERAVLTSYQDTVKVWTVGIGHTAAAGPPVPRAGFKLSLVETMDLFRKDVQKFVDRVNRALKVEVEQHEFDALVHFDYNTGGIFDMAGLRLLNAGDRSALSGTKGGFYGWLKNPELKSRREKERRMFVDGDYGDIRFIPVQDKLGAKVRMVPAADLMGSEPLKTGYTEQDLAEALAKLGFSDLRSFQKKVGVTVDGIAGPVTWGEIEDALEALEKRAAVQVPVVPTTPAPEVRRTLNNVDHDLARATQARLRDLGYFEVGEVDGLWGDRSITAMIRFTRENGLPLTGTPKPDALAVLNDMRTPKAKVGEARATATKADLKPTDSVVRNADLLTKIGTGVIASMGLGGITDGVVDIQRFQEGIATGRELIDGVLSLGPWVIGAAAGGVLIYYGNKIVRRQVEAYREGRTL